MKPGERIAFVMHWVLSYSSHALAPLDPDVALSNCDAMWSEYVDALALVVDLRPGERIAIDLADGELAVDRRHLREVAGTRNMMGPHAVGFPPHDLDLDTVMRDENDLLDGRDLLVLPDIAQTCPSRNSCLTPESSSSVRYWSKVKRWCAGSAIVDTR